jgi:hypothetical protein
VGADRCGPVLAKRRFYVIEGVPKEIATISLFGQVEEPLRRSRSTFQGAWNRKFSWKGRGS